MLRRLVGTTAPGQHDCSIQELKVSNHGSIPITIDSYVPRRYSSLVVEVTDSWLACPEFEPCTAEETPYRGQMRVEAVESSTLVGVALSSDLFSVCFGNSSKRYQARRRFVEWAQNEIAVVPDFHKRILFSDEAHFWLNGYVNKQNRRIWIEANPQVYVETPLHPEKLTVWCALWAIVESFKNDEGHNVTVNGDRYRAMITNFFIPELNNHDVQELWFQQDGATCHTARATIDLLKDVW
ncbi:DUF4817 domain-containing protein [Trichonephila clavipes]|nr:DUF4817 domain-containing protein [Trichonephila clavipes]